MRLIVPRVAALLPAAALLAATPAIAGEVGGHFTLDSCTFEPAHVYAFRAETDPLGEGLETILVFTDRPLEVGLAYSLAPDQAARDELTLGEDPSPMGLTVTLTGGLANYSFWCGDPAAGTTTQSSGHRAEARLRLSDEGDRRIAGEWTLAEAAGSTDRWALRFAVEVADPGAAAEVLPRKGGEPGKAYLRYLEDLAKGDVEALREFIDNPYYLREGADEAEIADDLELMRSSQPKSATITHAIADDTASVLDIDATLADGTTEKQRILLKKLDGRWVFGSSTSAE